MSTRTIESLSDLAESTRESPVVANIETLESRVLMKKHGIDTVESLEEFYRLYESPTHQFETDVVIREQGPNPSFDSSITLYDPPSIERVEYTGTVYNSSLNGLISEGSISWDDVESTTTCQSEVGDIITKAACDVDVIALVIVDGLSYQDWTQSGYEAEPVYVDCPTRTDCGYPNVVRGASNGKHLQYRLFDKGYKTRKAFTYWERKKNNLSDELHDGFSKNDVIGNIQDFGDSISYLQTHNWYKPKTYLQFTLTGPERVAHRMKEDPVIQSEVDAVHEKITGLRETIGTETDSFRIFVVADHGILWRMDNEFEELDGNWKQGIRRQYDNPPDSASVPESVGEVSIWGGQKCLRLYYPYVFNTLRSNEPGVHGGFSYQESIIPLIEYEGLK